MDNRMFHNNIMRKKTNLPNEIWVKIFSYCDRPTLQSLKMTCVLFYSIIDANSNVQNNFNHNLADLPSEIIMAVFSFLNKSELARCARVCRRFRDLASADCIWMNEAKHSLATNACHPEMKSRSVMPLAGAQDRVRISHNWVNGLYSEVQLIVQDIR